MSPAYKLIFKPYITQHALLTLLLMHITGHLEYDPRPDSGWPNRS